MKLSKIAYDLRVLFEIKITNYYRDSYKGILGRVQNEVLDYLYDHGVCTTKEIATKFSIPKQHASKVILRLVELNLVNCKTDINDKRVMHYYITKQGIDLVEAHIQDSDNHFEKKLQNLTKEELQELQDSMRTMIKLLKKL